MYTVVHGIPSQILARVLHESRPHFLDFYAVDDRLSPINYAKKW